MKGQVSIEFLASFFLYLAAIVLVFQFVSGEIPDFQKALEKKPLHYEAEYASTQVLTKPGYHTYGNGGTNWDKNSSTLNEVQNIGLAKDYLVLDRQKLGNISTVGSDKLNYSEFRDNLGLDHQYKFNFILKPIVETNRSFERGSSSKFTEPSNGLYSVAGLEVKYGSVEIGSDRVYFLVTKHRSGYNTTYISDDTDFSGETPRGVSDEVTISGEEYVIDAIQDRDYERGGLVVLRREIKEFGSQRDLTENVVKINRYVTYEAEGSEKQPMLVEVFAW